MSFDPVETARSKFEEIRREASRKAEEAIGRVKGVYREALAELEKHYEEGAKRFSEIAKG